MNLNKYTYPLSSLTPEILAARGNLTEMQLTHYIDKVYTYLLNMPSGKSVLIDSIANSDTKPMFIACTKLFISEVPKSGISFNNDFTQINKF